MKQLGIVLMKLILLDLLKYT